MKCDICGKVKKTLAIPALCDEDTKALVDMVRRYKDRRKKEVRKNG